jgi:hypothetical protein
MSNLTISQLPEWTGNTEGFYLPANNSGETTTYKITRETLFSGASGTSGTSGSSGSSGTSGTSGLGFNYQGGWQNNITYFLNDVVYYNGSSWVALTTISIGQNPPDINANWGEVAIAGTSGTSGSSGSSGSSGTDGTSGTSGVNGSAGSNGTSGTSGQSNSVYSGGTLVVSGATILNFSGATITSGATPGQANITITAGGGSSSGESFVEVEVSSSPTTNGTRLLAAYTAAKTKTPYGNALSQSNRYTIILPPGIYNVGSTALSLDTNFIDVVGSTTDLGNHQITGTIGSFVSVAANNLELRNLYILNNSTGYGFNGGGNRPGLLMDNMFFGYGSAGAAPWQAIVEGEFSGVASRLNAGQFYSATGGDTACIGNAGNCSGTISNIIAIGSVADGGVNGFAFNCKGGTISFGGRGYYGNSTGFMMNCRGGNSAFANSPGGTYINCHGADGAWAGQQSTILTGTYINCHSSAGSTSFGTSATRTLTGTMFYCSKRGGTDFAAPTGAGVIRLSIDGNNTITNNP